jgi:hypothetical protein
LRSNPTTQPRFRINEVHAYWREGKSGLIATSRRRMASDKPVHIKAGMIDTIATGSGW